MCVFFFNVCIRQILRYHSHSFEHFLLQIRSSTLFESGSCNSVTACTKVDKRLLHLYNQFISNHIMSVVSITLTGRIAYGKFDQIRFNFILCRTIADGPFRAAHEFRIRMVGIARAFLCWFAK